MSNRGSKKKLPIRKCFGLNNQLESRCSEGQCQTIVKPGPAYGWLVLCIDQPPTSVVAFSVCSVLTTTLTTSHLTSFAKYFKILSILMIIPSLVTRNLRPLRISSRIHLEILRGFRNMDGEFVEFPEQTESSG